ncbi:MAG: YbaK/EbsC family protein [Candidatus Micrarchaeota archaeon]
MNEYEEKLKHYINLHNIKAEHLSFKESCHSVKEAAEVVNAQPTDFIKSICTVDQNGNFFVGIVKGEDKVDISKIQNFAKLKLRIAKPDEMLEKTGYPCGGTPPFGFTAIFLIDQRVMEKEFVYGGGGSQTALLKISTKELQKANHGQIVEIKKLF